MKRREDIDALKAIGIILMILCHIDFGNTTDSLIHSFHMPLFFFVSGYLYKEGLQVRSFILTKARTLLIPYLVFGILHMILKLPMLIKEKDGIRSCIYHLFTFNFDGLPIAGALWFLTALFGTYVIFYFLNKVKTKELLLFLILIMSLTGTILPLCSVRLPWSLDISMAMLLPFYIAFVLKTKIDNVINQKGIAFDLIFLALIFWLLNDDVNVREGKYGNIVLFYLCSTLFTVGLFSLCHKLVKKEFMAKKYFLSIGTSSLIYMAFNQLLVWGPNQYFLHDYSMKGFVIKTVVLITVIFVLYWVAMFFEKSSLWQKLIKGHHDFNKK